MSEKESNNLELNEAAAPKKANIQQHIRSRVSLVKNRLKLPVSASLAASAVKDYVDVLQKNPKTSHYRILQKLNSQKRDAISQINSAVPIPTMLNASEGQLRRVLRDIVKEEKEMISEAAFVPPPVLMLQRQAIRMFPNGQRIALYTDNKYGLTFPVPYDQSGAGFGAVSTMGSGPINSVKGYVNEELVPVIFATGEEIQVEKSTMEKITEVYNSLNEENKVKLNDMILESKESFDKVKQFALLIK